MAKRKKKKNVFITDTHSWLWHMSNDRRLGKKAKAVFQNADIGKSVILIPTIVVAEGIYIAKQKGMLPEMEKIVQDLGLSSNYLIRPMDHRLLTALVKDKRKMSIHDKIITITAEMEKAEILSKDSVIVKLAKVKDRW